MDSSLRVFLRHSYLPLFKQKYAEDGYWKNLFSLWSHLSKDDLDTRAFKEWYQKAVDIIQSDNIKFKLFKNIKGKIKMKDNKEELDLFLFELNCICKEYDTDENNNLIYSLLEYCEELVMIYDLKQYFARAFELQSLIILAINKITLKPVLHDNPVILLKGFV